MYAPTIAEILEHERMARAPKIEESDARQASDDDIRRLARYCKVEGWDTLSLAALRDELGWMGVVNFTMPSMY